MASQAQNLLAQAQLKAQVQPRRERGVGPGAGIFLAAEYEHAQTGFGAVGKLGSPAEEVAAIATQELLEFHTKAAPVDIHLADQLLLPTALAATPSQYRTVEISTHLITNAWVIEQFGLAKTVIGPSTQLVTVTPTKFE